MPWTHGGGHKGGAGEVQLEEWETGVRRGTARLASVL